MNYVGPIYRPPPEAGTPLLQVTVGCSHNRCAFCTMFAGTRFAMKRLETIEEDLRELRGRYGRLRRLFLVGADPFVMSARRLAELARTIARQIPEVETLSMYASIRNIRTKSDADLRKLARLRISDLWIGVESGNDDVLLHLNKGYTAADAETQLQRLNGAGIRHNCIYMLGAAGGGRGLGHIADTARLVNATSPQVLRVTSLGFFEGSELSRQVAEGTFVPATEREILEEEKALIQKIELEDFPFFADHPVNPIRLAGTLPRDRARLIATIDDVLATADESFLSASAPRLSI